MRRLGRWCVCAGLLMAGACVPKGLEARTANGERRAMRADDALDEAQARLTAFEPEEAAESLAQAKELLQHRDVELYPDREFVRERLERLTAQLPAVKAERDRRRLEERLAAQQARFSKAHTAYAEALAVLEKQRDFDEDDAERAHEAQQGLGEVLEEGRSLEPQSAEYARGAQEAAAWLERTKERVKLAGPLVAFREGPARKAVEARARLARARDSDLPREERLDRWQQARSELTQCVEEGGRIVEKAPGVATLPMKVGEAVQTPKAVLAGCSTLLKKLEQRIQRAVARPAPKRTKTGAK